MSKSLLVKEEQISEWVKHWNKWTPKENNNTSSASLNKQGFNISAGIDNQSVNTNGKSTESPLVGEESRDNDTCCSICMIS